jgi:hypothetical protein
MPAASRFASAMDTLPSLTAVSCPSGTSCIAVGNYYTGEYSDQSLPLFASWTGSRWSFHSIHLPNNPYDASLDGLSCPSVSDCTAVGWTTVKLLPNGNEVRGPLVATWNGTSWSTTIA